MGNSLHTEPTKAWELAALGSLDLGSLGGLAAEDVFDLVDKKL